MSIPRVFFFFFTSVSSSRFVFFSRLFGRQEKLEQYLFKLRIAERKNREAKVAKMHKKIDRLRRRLAGEPVGSDEGEEVRDANLSLPSYARFPHHPLPSAPRTRLCSCCLYHAPTAVAPTPEIESRAHT